MIDDAKIIEDAVYSQPIMLQARFESYNSLADRPPRQMRVDVRVMERIDVVAGEMGPQYKTLKSVSYYCETGGQALSKIAEFAKP